LEGDVKVAALRNLHEGNDGKANLQKPQNGM
jgi:hypothetical protein